MKSADMEISNSENFTLKLETVKDAALARFKHCTDEVSGQLLDSVRIVYRNVDVDEDDRPEAIGTCFLFELNGRKYLVTAAHVFDFSKEDSIYVSGEKKLVRLRGDFWVTPEIAGSRHQDKHDFAFQVLTNEMVEELGAVRFIEASKVSNNRGTMEGRMFFAMGFPASRNKRKKIDPSRTHLRARAWTYCSTLLTDGIAALAIGASESVHLLLKHNHKFSRTFGGHQIRSVKPQGASGGLLVDLGVAHPSGLRPDAPCTWYVAGMLIEKHNKYDAIVVVKIGVIVDAMRAAAEDS
jgi:hypothetical protein